MTSLKDEIEWKDDDYKNGIIEFVIEQKESINEDVCKISEEKETQQNDWLIERKSSK